MGEICIRARDRQGDDPPPCVDPWDRAYDEDFARSGIRRFDITVLPPDRFSDDAMPEDRAERLLGRWYARSREAGPRNSVTVTGRFGQVCCGWQQPPTAAELYDAIRATPVETTESRIHDVAVRMRRMGTTGRLGRRRVHTEATGHGNVSPRMGNRTDKPVPEQLRTAAEKSEDMKARKGLPGSARNAPCYYIYIESGIAC